jgi:hypothetical protein
MASQSGNEAGGVSESSGVKMCLTDYEVSEQKLQVILSKGHYMS